MIVENISNSQLANTTFPDAATRMALPPEHQRAREEKAILNDPRLHALLGDQEVVSLGKTANGYLIKTDQGQEIFAALNYIPSGIGPRKFEIDSFEVVKRAP